MTFKRRLGEELAEARRKKRLKQNEAAKLVGISTPFLCLIENNKRTPGIDTLRALADTYEVKLSTLIRRAEEPRKYT